MAYALKSTYDESFPECRLPRPISPPKSSIRVIRGRGREFLEHNEEQSSQATGSQPVELSAKTTRKAIVQNSDRTDLEKYKG